MTRHRTRSDRLRWSASRRPGIIPGRRFALALALTVALVGGWGGVALADNSGQLVTATIWPPSGGITTSSVSLSTLEGSAPCPTYTGPDIQLYNPDGTQAPAETLGKTRAWSLASVLGCLSTPVHMSDVKKVLVVQAGGAPELGTNSQLLVPDLSSPSGFVNGSEAPVIFSDGNGIGYLRPRRGTGDANAQDRVYVQPPAALMLEVFERTVLGATITASSNPAPVGGTISFSASAPGMGPGLSYGWDFGGAAPSSTLPNPSATFTSAGTYTVTVQVTDAAADTPSLGTLLVKVGNTTPTSASPSAPTQGPTHSNGSTPNGVPSSHRTATPGKSNSGKSATPGNSKHHHPPAATTTPPSGNGSTGSGRSGSGSSRAGGATASRAGGGHARHSAGRAANPAKRRPTPTTALSTLITGRLISHVTALPAGASPLIHAVPGSLATAPSARRTITASLPPAFAAVLGVFLLFSLGAGRELRWGRNLRHLLFGT